MKRLLIIIALATILLGGCGPKEEIVLKIPGSNAQIIMRLIPEGSFVMGSPADELDRDDDEGPQHTVTISKRFYMGIYQVTQEQWQAVMGNNPSEFISQGSPVERISWSDCQAFITELNTKGIGKFRLPTEAEWEYACRAGSTTRFPWGDDLTYSEIGTYAWYLENSDFSTHTVGQKAANRFGLYDMQGNVWEWCNDWYGDYDASPQVDPKGPAEGDFRTARGGSWFDDPFYFRSANRYDFDPADKYNNLGFRLVRTAP